jgi:hypothetical protein
MTTPSWLRSIAARTATLSDSRPRIAVTQLRLVPNPLPDVFRGCGAPCLDTAKEFCCIPGGVRIVATPLAPVDVTSGMGRVELPMLNVLPANNNGQYASAINQHMLHSSPRSQPTAQARGQGAHRQSGADEPKDRRADHARCSGHKARRGPNRDGIELWTSADSRHTG